MRVWTFARIAMGTVPQVFGTFPLVERNGGHFHQDDDGETQ
jgi:hypothetical protein